MTPVKCEAEQSQTPVTQAFGWIVMDIACVFVCLCVGLEGRLEVFH